MDTKFGGRISADLLSPYVNGSVITPDDTVELTQTPRALWIGGTGHLNVILQGDTSATLISAIPAGTLLPIRPKVIKLTSTTASLIVALW